MAWNGWFDFAGVELINVERTQTYMRTAQQWWFRPTFDDPDLGVILDEQYRSPLQDDAPWTDPANPNSYDFFGFFPLAIDGIEGSTAKAEVTESILDGGQVSRSRKETRPVVFSGLLLASSEAGAEYGMGWLKAALSGGPCAGRTACDGDTLCFFSSEPFIDGQDPAECFVGYQQTLHKVSRTTGPSLDGKRTMTNGGQAWAVTFTLVAANPGLFGADEPLVEGFLATVDDPYVGGAGADEYWDPNGLLVNNQLCGVDVVQLVFDPECAAIVPPPSVPGVLLGCYTPPTNWRRYAFTIPPDKTPLWTETIPTLTVEAVGGDLRTIRVRFYARGDSPSLNISDECGWCSETILSYIPQDSTLVIDGTDGSIYLQSPNGLKRRADSLVYQPDGSPIDWPTLSCGYGYTVTIDTLQTSLKPVVGLTLTTQAD